MLRRLQLENVGPAPSMEMELGSRVNLITGDNGLGKSFLLDVAWWSLTRRWPQEVNRRMTSGLPARPRDRTAPASISLSVKSKTTDVDYTSTYNARDEAWTGRAGRPWIPGLVIYSHADGSFSVWDPARNYWMTKGDIDVQDRLPAYVFTPSEVWNGLNVDVNGESALVCQGLLLDWAFWIRGQDENAKLMERALAALSPAGGTEDVLRPGPLTRLSVNDAREIPSIQMPYSGPVPILHASAGVRRITALAYMLTWAWSEHKRAAEQLGEDATKQIVLLVDEVESHLHPRWQRQILTALRTVVETLHEEASCQLMVATHSPLVLASAEPWFDPEKDAWFDLDLEGEPPEVILRKRDFTLQGSAGNWLTSAAFDLPTDRGSVPAENAILWARDILQRSEFDPLEVRMAHAALRAVLSDLDPFWVRWNAFFERHGAAR